MTDSMIDSTTHGPTPGATDRAGQSEQGARSPGVSATDLDGAGLAGCVHYAPPVLIDLLDGLLPPGSAERSQLIDHVCTCRACQLELRAACDDGEPAAFEGPLGQPGASVESLLQAVRHAARHELLVVLREWFGACLLVVDGAGRVQCEQLPRGAAELFEQLRTLATRLQALGVPGALAGLPTACPELTGRPRQARAAALAALAWLERLGDGDWARFGRALLASLAGEPEPGPGRGPHAFVGADLATLADAADPALRRGARLLLASLALEQDRPDEARAHAERVLGERADDLAALSFRLAARARQGDVRGFRKTARRFGATEHRHPNRRWRAWALARVPVWAAGLGRAPERVADWLGLRLADGGSSSGRHPRSRSRAGSTAGDADAQARRGAPPPATLLVLPAPHGRAWRPGTLGEPQPDATAG